MLAVILPLLALLVRVSAVASTEPYFTVVHAPLVRTRMDPIITPGNVSSHVHLFAGSSAVTAGATFDTVSAGNCTTSYIQADKSLYWAPHLYYKTKSGELIAIESDGLVTYWKYARYSDDEEFAVVPDDFRMTAGNISRDYYDATQPSHLAISFECVGTNSDDKYPWIPNDRECPTIRPQAFFPSCWDGVHSYLPDNAHVAYPADQYEGGKCGDGWKRIPNLFMETYYHMSWLGDKYEWYPGCLVLANGDNNGFSFHADWLNGWPTGMLVDAFNECQDNLIGDTSACSVLHASADTNKAYACIADDAQIAGEAIGGTTNISVLPGNNPIFNSSRMATSGDYTYPQHPDPDYVEQTVLVDVPADKEGICSPGGPRVCPDYTHGGTPSGVATSTSNTVNGSSASALPDDGATTSSALWLAATVSGADAAVISVADATVVSDTDILTPSFADDVALSGSTTSAAASSGTCQVPKSRKRRLGLEA